MSETRPPITAGPMARAFRFLKRTSLSCVGAGEGTGVTEADNGGVVLTGEALGEAPLTGAAPGGVSSWAGRWEGRQIESRERERSERWTGISDRRMLREDE